jgi:hypothetical protein
MTGSNAEPGEISFIFDSLQVGEDSVHGRLREALGQKREFLAQIRLIQRTLAIS